VSVPKEDGAIKEFHLTDPITVGRSGRKRKGGRSRQHRAMAGVPIVTVRRRVIHHI
jgi:hypothetical protein